MKPCTRIPDYIKELLDVLPQQVEIYLLQLLAEKTNLGNIAQNRYRAKLIDDRQEYVYMGAAVQYYKDIKTLEMKGDKE